MHVRAWLDVLASEAHWTFESLDPATGELPADPFAGFLPPNLTSPEGEGSVSFTIPLHPNLTNGTQITNQGSIQFNRNPWMQTATWRNAVDISAPSSRVSPLSATQGDSVFVVNWTGEDLGSGVKDYSVSVSEDGTAPVPWRLNVAALADSFRGRNGHSYAFYCAARDSAGNVEPTHSTPDAATGITPVLGSLVSSEASPTRVSLKWFTGDQGSSALVAQRNCDDHRGWQPHGTLLVDGTGYATEVDEDVAPGGRYGYRLARASAPDATAFGEVWVDVPASPRGGPAAPGG